MKLKAVKIIVESFEEMNCRWEKALRGGLKSNLKGEIVSVANWDVLGKVLSPPRLQILSLIPQLKPRSIAGLAKAMKKNFKNVHSDVKFLADLGLIELKKEGPRKTLKPIAKFNQIDLPFAA